MILKLTIFLLVNVAVTAITAIFVVPRIDCASFPPPVAQFCPSSSHALQVVKHHPTPPLDHPLDMCSAATDLVRTDDRSSDLLHKVQHNFAAASHGAKPLSELCRVNEGFGASLWGLLRPPTSRCGDAYLALQEDHHCWEFRGPRAQIGIRLSDWTSVAYMRLESGRTVEESPREVLVWGLLDGPENRRRFSAVPGEIKDALRGTSVGGIN